MRNPNPAFRLRYCVCVETFHAGVQAEAFFLVVYGLWFDDGLNHSALASYVLRNPIVADWKADRNLHTLPGLVRGIFPGKFDDVRKDDSVH